VLLTPSPRTSELEYPTPLGGAVVVGVSAARAVCVLLEVVVGGDGGVDLDADEEGEGGGEETDLVVVAVSKESEVGIEASDEDGEDIADGRIVAFATARGVVDMVCIVVDWSCAFICVDFLYAAVGQKHWHLQPSFPEPALPLPPPAAADGRTVVWPVAVFVPVAAGVVVVVIAAEEDTVPLILIAASLNI